MLYENSCDYVTSVLTGLKEDGYFILEQNTTDVSILKTLLTKWAEINFKLYGDYQLDSEQFKQILAGARRESTIKVMAELGEEDLVSLYIDSNGNMVHVITNMGEKSVDSLSILNVR